MICSPAKMGNPAPAESPYICPRWCFYSSRVFGEVTPPPKDPSKHPSGTVSEADRTTRSPSWRTKANLQPVKSAILMRSAADQRSPRILLLKLCLLAIPRTGMRSACFFPDNASKALICFDMLMLSPHKGIYTKEVYLSNKNIDKYTELQHIFVDKYTKSVI